LGCFANCDVTNSLHTLCTSMYSLWLLLYL